MLPDSLADKLNPLKTKAFSLLDGATEKASSLDDYIADSISHSVGSRWDAWLIQHPFFGWLVNHPLISLVGSLIVIIFTVRLLVTIYRAIANTIDRMWLWILRSPFFLLKLLFGWEVKSKTPISNTTVTNYEVTNNSEQLQKIIALLDQIQQQQQQIIKELAQSKQQHIVETETLHLTEEK